MTKMEHLMFWILIGFSPQEESKNFDGDSFVTTCSFIRHTSIPLMRWVGFKVPPLAKVSVRSGCKRWPWIGWCRNLLRACASLPPASRRHPKTRRRDAERLSIPPHAPKQVTPHPESSHHTGLFNNQRK